MPYRVCKTFEVESGHMLAKHPEKCRFPHGHSRRIELVLEAPTLDASEMVCDFKALKELMHDYLETFDHALCVNSDDPQAARLKEVYGERIIEFANLDPTTEVMAEVIYRHLQKALAGRLAESGARYPVREEVRIVRVRVWETSSSWAEYWE